MIAGTGRVIAGTGRVIVAHRQLDVAGRHHGGNRVFINHLIYAVAQQHNKLVEGINLALQFDAVYQVYGHWHPFLAQCIQERIL